MLSRLAIVNRGEPALRLIRAVRQLNEEGRQDITVIALHTEAEQRALLVRAADEAVCLRDDVPSGRPYLDHDELERALRLSRADAVWVGWGFVAEDPSFADLCERLGLTFIGPPARAMRQLGDKIEAKLLAEKTGVLVGVRSIPAGWVHAIQTPSAAKVAATPIAKSPSSLLRSAPPLPRQGQSSILLERRPTWATPRRH